MSAEEAAPQPPQRRRRRRWRGDRGGGGGGGDDELLAATPLPPPALATPQAILLSPRRCRRRSGEEGRRRSSKAANAAGFVAVAAAAFVAAASGGSGGGASPESTASCYVAGAGASSLSFLRRPRPGGVADNPRRDGNAAKAAGGGMAKLMMVTTTAHTHNFAASAPSSSRISGNGRNIRVNRHAAVVQVEIRVLLSPPPPPLPPGAEPTAAAAAMLLPPSPFSCGDIVADGEGGGGGESVDAGNPVVTIVLSAEQRQGEGAVPGGDGKGGGGDWTKTETVLTDLRWDDDGGGEEEEESGLLATGEVTSGSFACIGSLTKTLLLPHDEELFASDDSDNGAGRNLVVSLWQQEGGGSDRGPSSQDGGQNHRRLLDRKSLRMQSQQQQQRRSIPVWTHVHLEGRAELARAAAGATAATVVDRGATVHHYPSSSSSWRTGGGRQLPGRFSNVQSSSSSSRGPTATTGSSFPPAPREAATTTARPEAATKATPILLVVASYVWSLFVWTVKGIALVAALVASAVFIKGALVAFAHDDEDINNNAGNAVENGNPADDETARLLSPRYAHRARRQRQQQQQEEEEEEEESEEEESSSGSLCRSTQQQEQDQHAGSQDESGEEEEDEAEGEEERHSEGDERGDASSSESFGDAAADGRQQNPRENAAFFSPSSSASSSARSSSSASSEANSSSNGGIELPPPMERRVIRPAQGLSFEDAMEEMIHSGGGQPSASADATAATMAANGVPPAVLVYSRAAMERLSLDAPPLQSPPPLAAAAASAVPQPPSSPPMEETCASTQEGFPEGNREDIDDDSTSHGSSSPPARGDGTKNRRAATTKDAARDEQPNAETSPHSEAADAEGRNAPSGLNFKSAFSCNGNFSEERKGKVPCRFSQATRDNKDNEPTSKDLPSTKAAGQEEASCEDASDTEDSQKVDEASNGRDDNKVGDAATEDDHGSASCEESGEDQASSSGNTKVASSATKGNGGFATYKDAGDDQASNAAPDDPQHGTLQQEARASATNHHTASAEAPEEKTARRQVPDLTPVYGAAVQQTVEKEGVVVTETAIKETRVGEAGSLAPPRRLLFDKRPGGESAASRIETSTSTAPEEQSLLLGFEAKETISAKERPGDGEVDAGLKGNDGGNIGRLGGGTQDDDEVGRSVDSTGAHDRPEDESEAQASYEDGTSSGKKRNFECFENPGLLRNDSVAVPQHTTDTESKRVASSTDMGQRKKKLKATESLPCSLGEGSPQNRLTRISIPAKTNRENQNWLARLAGLPLGEAGSDTTNGAPTDFTGEPASREDSVRQKSPRSTASSEVQLPKVTHHETGALALVPPDAVAADLPHAPKPAVDQHQQENNSIESSDRNASARQQQVAEGSNVLQGTGRGAIRTESFSATNLATNPGPSDQNAVGSSTSSSKARNDPAETSVPEGGKRAVPRKQSPPSLTPDFSYVSTLPPDSDASLDRPDLGRARRCDEPESSTVGSRDDDSVRVVEVRGGAKRRDATSDNFAVPDIAPSARLNSCVEELNAPSWQFDAKNDSQIVPSRASRRATRATKNGGDSKIRSEPKEVIDLADDSSASRASGGGTSNKAHNSLLPEIVPSASLVSAVEQLKAPVWQFNNRGENAASASGHKRKRQPQSKKEPVDAQSRQGGTAGADGGEPPRTRRRMVTVPPPRRQE